MVDNLINFNNFMRLSLWKERTKNLKIFDKYKRLLKIIQRVLIISFENTFIITINYQNDTYTRIDNLISRSNNSNNYPLSCFLLGYRLKGTIFARISRLIRLLAIEQPQFTLDARISLVSVGSSSPLPFHPLVRVHVEAAS